MFCPKCAAHNLDDAKFCRACGADISLVPQVMSGQMSERIANADAGRVESRDARRERRPASIEHAFKKLFVGIAFLLIAILSFSGVFGVGRWGLWMLIPALAMLGEGIGGFARVKQQQQQMRAINPPSYAPPYDALSQQQQQRVSALNSLRTGELVERPPSVTEGTTRHLGIPIERTSNDS